MQQTPAYGRRGLAAQSSACPDLPTGSVVACLDAYVANPPEPKDAISYFTAQLSERIYGGDVRAALAAGG